MKVKKSAIKINSFKKQLLWFGGIYLISVATYGLVIMLMHYIVNLLK